MAISQDDARFLCQNFPGSTSIPADQVRDLASQMGINLSNELNALISEGQESILLDDERSFDIDISDIPLDLKSAPTHTPFDPADPLFVEGNQPPLFDSDLSQYDDMIDGAFAANDYVDYGQEHQNSESPPSSFNHQNISSFRPVVSEQNALSPTAPMKSTVDFGAQRAFASGDPDSDADGLEENDKFGEKNNIRRHILREANSNSLDFSKFPKKPHRYLDAETVRDRLAKVQALHATEGVEIDAYTMSKKDISALRFVGPPISNLSVFGKLVDDEFYETSGVQLGEELYSNRTAFDKENEANMVEQDANLTEVSLEGKKDPGGNGETVSINKNPGEIKPKALEALKSLDGIADQGVVRFDLVEAIFDQHGVSKDEPVYQKILTDRVRDGGLFDLESLKAFAGDNPVPKAPTSQPAESTNPTTDTAAKELEEEKDLEEKKKDPKFREMQSNVVGAGFHFMGGMGQSASGAVKALTIAAGTLTIAAGKGAMGGVKNISGFVNEHKAKQQRFGHGMATSINHLSSSLDSIASDRVEMKSASNMFERKQIADRMGTKMNDLAGLSNNFADILSSKQGMKAVKKLGMATRLESLHDKFDKTMAGMDPGKGEVKAFENIKESVEAAMKAIQQLIQIISQALSGPTQDHANAGAMNNGPS
jgi:hypothetical protein